MIPTISGKRYTDGFIRFLETDQSVKFTAYWRSKTFKGEAPDKQTAFEQASTWINDARTTFFKRKALARLRYSPNDK